MNRLSIRWRLTLVSLGLLTILLSGLGFIILFTAEKALLINESVSLRSEVHVSARDLKGQSPLVQADGSIYKPSDLEIMTNPLTSPPPPPGPAPADFAVEGDLLLRQIVTASTDAIILSPSGTKVLVKEDFPWTPATVKLSSKLIQQALLSKNPNNYIMARDQSGARQLVIVLPITSDHHTVGILELNTPTGPSVDSFVTTLRLVLILGIVGAVSIAVALTFPLIGAALHPLVTMEQTSRRVAEGELYLRMEVPLTDDEIGHLAISFNRMVAQLEAAFQRQKQFVGDVSHELRTPLTALSGSMEMLMIGADRGDIEASRRLARNMYAEVQRMHRLIEDLLALSRLDEQKIAFRKDALDIRPIVEKIYDQAQQLAHDQEISYTIEPGTPFVLADGDRLQQVLLNVVDNAVKFTPPQGKIKISVYRAKPASIRIEIRDTGKGIPPEALPHVFDRFYRVDPSRSRLPKGIGGSGLGLAIAKELIEAQGGSILLKSTLERGTIVTIQLPAAHQIAEQTVTSSTGNA
ncbi:MAG TPA: ATP-binding protein [Dictyobacter sp.]|nr:ATP-binding protein [Dictyobacter sp.]